MDPSMEIKYEDVKIELHDIDTEEEDRFQKQEIIVKTEPEQEDKISIADCSQKIKLEINVNSWTSNVLPNVRNTENVYLNETSANQSSPACYLEDARQETEDINRCSQCDKSFTQKLHLIRHQRLHIGEKSHQCKYCNKIFSRKDSLIRHQRLHTGEKTYQCKECNKRFTSKSILIQHMRTHTGEKYYQCSLCDKAFVLKLAFNEHQKTHTREKPYKCSLCDKAFVTEWVLVSHQIVHTREKSYP